MIKAQVIQDAKILIPNTEHKNFTDSGNVIEEGTFVSGQIKNIQGLRRGKSFVYRLFLTDKNQLIHLKKIKPMGTTEVTLGADSAQSPTQVNLRPAERADKNKFIGVVVGGIAGFAWAKYKKHDMKKSAMYIGVGAVLGLAVGYMLDRRKNKVTIKPSK
jgi:hypothetical protein